ncbi:MAG: hypothetical protein EKK53_19920 [Burkholderiales bacterium]|nr:MAG: hypothetical protein EKK53_19920 [Burkholderiales bacterium]
MSRRPASKGKALGLVAVAAGVAVAVAVALSGREPQVQGPATDGLATASHLALPSPASSVAAAVAVPVGAASALAALPAASSPALDSRGIAPLVQRALDSGDPKDALEAAQWLAACLPDQDVESMLNGSHAKYRIQVSDTVRRQWIENVRQTERHCQTVTPDLMAQYRTLASRALDAKLPGAGLAYFQSLDRDNRTDAERARALPGLKADAEQGLALAVPILARSTLGQSRTEQLAYQKLTDHLVQRELLPPMMGALMPGDAVSPPYTAQEQADAAAIVRRLLPRFKKPD